MMLKFVLAVLFLSPALASGAAIYIDAALGSNCTSGNYSPAQRSCTGSSGNAYNNIQSALTASAAGDTINIRSGTYISNVSSTEGIIVKSSQTWQTHPGDSTRATVQAASSHVQVFKIDFVNNVTIQNLIIRGGTQRGIFSGYSSNIRIIKNDIAGYNTSSSEYRHGIDLTDCCGGSFGPKSIGNYIADNYVHDQGAVEPLSAGIAVLGDTSSTVVERNRVERTGMGIWLDVNSGNPDLGNTQHTIQDNIVKNVQYHCYHAEARSAWVLQRNICSGAGETGIHIRPGGTMKNHKILNNTIYNTPTAFWLNYEYPASSDSHYINASVRNNIFISNGVNAVLIVARPMHQATENSFYMNNLLLSTGGNAGVCWGDDRDTSRGCDAGGVIYPDTSSGFASWQSVAPFVSGTLTADPLFISAASGDFRLCEGFGTPVSTCVGKSLAIDAGMPVGLAYTGIAPDLGAIESDGTDSEIAAPTNLRIVNP